MKKKVYIIATEHFDIMWRRPFERDFTFKGENYVSYADLEGYYIEDNIALCGKYPEYKFTIESVAVLRKFLERHPEYLVRLKELYAEGRVFTTFSGDNIVDSNMVQGESIIRNYLYGKEYLKDNFNYEPYGIDRNDAFGNSGQLPQIARGFDNKWIYHITYTETDKPYWKGIDGSCVYSKMPEQVGYTGGYYKYRPCPVCNGQRNITCDACGGRRIDVPYMEQFRVKFKNVDEKKLDASPIPGYVYAGGEEILPIEDIVIWARTNQDKYDIEFVGFDNKYTEDLAEYLNRVDEVGDDEIHSMQEVNVNNTGTYVTRIKTKQKVRENENLMSRVENLSTILGMNGGAYYRDYIQKTWPKLHYTMFHDAITGTHIDAAYEELMDVSDAVKRGLLVVNRQLEHKFTEKAVGKITVLNTLGIEASCIATAIVEGDCHTTLESLERTPVTVLKKRVQGKEVAITFVAGAMAPFSTKEFSIVQSVEEAVSENFELDMSINGDVILTNVVADKSVVADTRQTAIENEYYRVIAEDNGIVSVYDKQLGRMIAEKSQYYVGEYILEHDEGSAWTTLSQDMHRFPLSKYTKLVAHETTKDLEKLTFRVRIETIVGYAVSGMELEYSVLLYKSMKRVIFQSKVYWNTQNYRLRIAFPCNLTGKHIYEIPYGYIQRTPYSPKLTLSDGSVDWAGAAGDWPAINWAGIWGEEYSVALLNKGTPSYQINTDEQGTENIYLSVLRSPSVGTYLHDAAAYTMTDYDGMRDFGEHYFEYALVSYENGFNKNSVVADAYAYNCQVAAFVGKMKPMLIPKFISSDARISAMKPSQKGNMLVLRIVEYHGVEGAFELKLPKEWNVKNVWELNMNEKPIRKLEIKDNTLKMNIGKFKILTIGMEK